MRDEFQKQIEAEQFNCTLPWIQSMQGVFIYNDTSTKPCNNYKEYEDVSYFGYQFAQNASTYSHLTCPGTQEIWLYIYHSISIGNKTIISIIRLIIFYTAYCDQATFDVGIQTYDALSKISINDEGNSRAISIYYATTDVKVSTTSEVIDFPTFISNVGGNLGLFVEFSILGGLFFVYDFLAARFLQWMF